MTVQAIEEVIQRARDDEAFREQLERDPDAAMHGYQINYQERAAITAGDEKELTRLGVSPELCGLIRQYNERFRGV